MLSPRRMDTTEYLSAAVRGTLSRRQTPRDMTGISRRLSCIFASLFPSAPFGSSRADKDDVGVVHRSSFSPPLGAGQLCRRNTA